MNAAEGLLLALAALSATLYVVIGFLLAMRVTTLACLALPTESLRMAFLSALVLQTAGAAVTNCVLRGGAFRWHWVPLEILRSYLLFFCWLGASITRRVNWRGHEFELGHNSVITPAEAGLWHRVLARCAHMVRT